jgi:hypothetical protein
VGSAVLESRPWVNTQAFQARREENLPEAMNQVAYTAQPVAAARFAWPGVLSGMFG